MREFMYCCESCGGDLTYVGDLQQATADCPNCGTQFIIPSEIIASEDAERQMDEAKDERLERDD